jgi:hypothetical protein
MQELTEQRKPGGGNMPRKKKNSEGNVGEKSMIEKSPGKHSKDELELIAKFRKRLKREPMKVTSLAALVNDRQEGQDKLLTLAKMTEAMGSPDYGAQMLLFDQVASTFKGLRSSEGYGNDETVGKVLNNALAILNGINPQNEIEGMLAVQMVGVHNIAMDAMRLAMISDQLPEAKERNTNQAIKLLRTFTAQIEALDKHRRNGQQKVVVKHVHVNEGGQAIVGNINQGGGGKDGK